MAPAVRRPDPQPVLARFRNPSPLPRPPPVVADRGGELRLAPWPVVEGDLHPRDAAVLLPGVSSHHDVAGLQHRTVPGHVEAARQLDWAPGGPAARGPV